MSEAPFDHLFQSYYENVSSNDMSSAWSKRKTNVSVEDLVAEKLECPVCLKPIKDPPVFLCDNGHELSTNVTFSNSERKGKYF